MRLGAIEAGGTKFVMSVGSEDGTIFEKETIPTTTPAETMKGVLDFFHKYPVEAIGIGCFGPIDLNKKSKTYGYITTTPKEGWQWFDIVGSLKELQVPIGFDTDVSVCAYAEWKLGSAKGLNSCLYITVGTGIGAGMVINGNTVQNMIHPEMGHVPVIRHPHDAYPGGCPAHQDCLEGMAAGPNFEKRVKKKAVDTNPDCPAWDIEAYYLAQGIYTYTLVTSVEKVIMWGGVMHQSQLFPLIREHFKTLNNSYLQHERLNNLEEYICPPALGDNVGVIGCLLLAKDQLEA